MQSFLSNIVYRKPLKMITKTSIISWFLLYVVIFISSNGASGDEAKEYIVYMGDRPKLGLSAATLHTNLLKQVLGSNASSSLLYNYKRSFNGFVAKLTQEEMLRVSSMEGVVSVFPNGKKKLHTTRSWDFMGFSQQVNRTLTVESDIIIGVLDSGIWPESDSFSDSGFGAPPAKWRGSCQATNFTCNNKIIGAQYYKSDGLFGAGEFISPRDNEGHGTHTASTAAGGLVSSASLMGLGLGTARGGVPSARIAVYKICWSDGCADADILAAFDDAIADGVDIISLSVGGSVAENYFQDSIAIGTFHAMRNGILTSTSAGNEGPDLGTTSNISPWQLSVAASTIDRKFLTRLQLGNNMAYEGVSLNTFDPKNVMSPMIYAGDAPNITGGFTGSLSRFCGEDSLDPTLVNGRIVLCDSVVIGDSLLIAGAAGVVMQDSGDRDSARSFPLPATTLGVNDGDSIFSYIRSITNPTGIIFQSNESNEPLAPFVASFSSRGPNLASLDVLKPDLSAPGVDILAAWSLAASVSGSELDSRRVAYNMISGTSMACPHVTGIAAYVKSFHPSWSPAAIKSALMTTASSMSASGSLDAEFAYGAGHVNPIRAINPGLIYDVTSTDYIRFLCGDGYSTSFLQIITGDNSDCSEAISPWNLNLPSYAYMGPLSESFRRTFSRTVTNVGSPVSTYTARVTATQGLSVQVVPNVLSFTSVDQKLNFVVTVQGVIQTWVQSASLVWDDGEHQVRIPIVVYRSS